MRSPPPRGGRRHLRLRKIRSNDSSSQLSWHSWERRSTPATSSCSTPGSTRVEELRLIAKLFRDRDASSLATVRAGSLTRRSLATALYEFHRRAGDHRLAADVMVRSARQWGEPNMWLRAAKSFASHGDQPEAASAARQVLESGIGSASERESALISIAEATSALGRWQEARAATLRLLELEPESEDFRWAHIRVLFEAGDPEAALAAFAGFDVQPAPRNGNELLLIAQLHRLFGDTAIEASRLVMLSNPWRDEEEVRGRVLLCILVAPPDSQTQDDEDEEPSPETLIVREAMSEFTRSFPTSSIMYSVEFDPANPLDSLLAALGESPDTSELDALVIDGKAPMGFAASIHSRTYAEVVLRRATPGRFIDDRARREALAGVLADSHAGTGVVMDTTAAFTLSLFERALRSELLGSLPNVATASELVTDAREASPYVRSRVRYVFRSGCGGWPRDPDPS